MKNMASINYGAIANSYDELHVQEQFLKYREIKKFIHKKDELLDIGSGTGLLEEYLSSKAVCIEPCKSLIDIHLSKNRKGLIINKKIEELSFPQKSFDVVVAMSSLHHVKNLQEVISNMKKWSRKIVIISMFTKSKKFKEFLEIIRNEELLLKKKVYKD